MKKGNKLTAAVTASAVVAAMAAPASAAVNFNDINNSFAKDAILKLAEMGILNGKGEGTFDPTGNVTRAEFAKILVLSLGLKTDAAPATGTFSDVGTDHWSYKYVEAAVAAKLINGLGDGKFGPSEQLTREQMATLFVRALGTDVAGKAAGLTFTDKASISAYAADSVAYAVELGLINGVGGNAFNPQGTATREAVAKVANLFLDKIAPSTLVIEGDTNVGIGEKVTFKVKDFNGAVTWSVSGNGVIDQTGTFVGNAAGKVTVTATANGKSVTKEVQVYGVAASVKFGAVKELVANSESTQEVALEVVDANGNLVENFNGFVDLAIEEGHINFYANDAKAGVTAAAKKITNGVVKFTIASNTDIAGLSDTIVASNLVNANSIAVKGYENVSVEVSTVDQVATAVKLTSEHDVLAANEGIDTSVVTITVVDQDGKEMVAGTHGLKVNISGPAVFNDTADTVEKSLSFVGGAVADPTVTVRALKGKTGNITVTVTSEGLTTGTATIKSAVAQDLNKLTVKNAVSTNTDNTVVQGEALDFVVGAVDENGTPIRSYDATGGAVTVYVTKDGKTATDIEVNGTAVTKDGVVLTDNNIAITATGAAAGTYKLVVKDNAATGALKAADELTFVLNADVATGLSLSEGTDYVAASNPTTTFTVQTTDQFGNAVKKEGVEVTFTATNVNSGSTAKASFNGKTAKTTAEGVLVTATTDAEGKATVNFTSQGYNMESWNVEATATDFTTSDVENVTVVTMPVAQVKLALKGDVDPVTTVGSSTKITAGSNFSTIQISQHDAYGAEIDPATGENDRVKVTVSNVNAVEWTAATPGVSVDEEAGTITGRVTDVNTYLATLVADKAGTVSFTVTDLSIPNAKSATASIRVVAGALDGFLLFGADGKEVTDLTVEANKEVALTLKPVDAQGNPVVAEGNLNILLDDADTGSFRTASGGAPAAGNVVSFKDGATSKTVYYVNATAGTYTLSAVVQP